MIAPVELLEQARAPLFEAMRDYAARTEMIPFHTPGHKQGMGAEAAFGAWVGAAVLRMDLTELDELDDLHHPEGVIEEAQALAAAAFGAEASYFLINGATAGLHAMVMTVCDPGESLILPRGAHPAVLRALTLAGAHPVECPEPGPASLERTLRAHPEAKGVLVTQPDPFGAACDMAGLAAVCHAHGKPLLVDEAGGAHWHFHEALPTSGMAAGADMVAHATHKTLPALRQAGMLHVRHGRLDAGRVRRVLALVQSSSPNYVLMASLDTARRHMALHGHALLTEAIALAADARRRLGAMPGVALFEPAGARDVTMLAVDVSGLGLSGSEASRALRERFAIQPERAVGAHVLLNVSVGTTPRDVERLVDAFGALSREQAKLPGVLT